MEAFRDSARGFSLVDVSRTEQNMSLKKIFVCMVLVSQAFAFTCPGTVVNRLTTCSCDGSTWGTTACQGFTGGPCVTYLPGDFCASSGTHNCYISYADSAGCFSPTAKLRKPSESLLARNFLPTMAAKSAAGTFTGCLDSRQAFDEWLRHGNSSKQ